MLPNQECISYAKILHATSLKFKEVISQSRLIELQIKFRLTEHDLWDLDPFNNNTGWMTMEKYMFGSST